MPTLECYNHTVAPTPLLAAGETEHGHELPNCQCRIRILVNLILRLRAVMSFRELFSRPSKERDTITGNTSSSRLGSQPKAQRGGRPGWLQRVDERTPHLHPNLCHVIKMLKRLSCFP